jgi:hypothetical protein
MAKFIQVHSPDNHSYYVNVEMIEYVAQKRRPQIYLRYISLANASCQ